MMDEIRKRMRQVPFTPFAIRTSDGHEYAVHTVDHALITPRGNRVVVVDDEGTTAVLGPLHIKSIIKKNGE
jgi:outer membrane lipoprotein SlyB